jgi:cell filamentation protein
MATKKKISRYNTPKGPETEFQPGSRRQVLRNLLGITSKREMDKAEYQALLRVQEAYLKKIDADKRFTATLICRMHRDWLGKIYPWAGHYRTVELQKGAFRWPPAFRVAENMATLERDLLARQTPCRPGPLPEVARRIAEVHAELLLIHPFREGNGRLAALAGGTDELTGRLPPPGLWVYRQREHEKAGHVSRGGHARIRPGLRCFDRLLRRSDHATLGGNARMNLQSQTACALEIGGLPGGVSNHATAGTHVPQVRIRL